MLAESGRISDNDHFDYAAHVIIMVTMVLVIMVTIMMVIIVTMMMSIMVTMMMMMRVVTGTR